MQGMICHALKNLLIVCVSERSAPPNAPKSPASRPTSFSRLTSSNCANYSKSSLAVPFCLSCKKLRPLFQAYIIRLEL